MVCTHQAFCAKGCKEICQGVHKGAWLCSNDTAPWYQKAARCLCALAFLALHHGHFWHYIIVCPNLHSINAFGFVHCSNLLSLALAKFHNVHPSAPIPIYAMRKHVQGICIFTWSTSLLARGTAPLTDRRTTPLLSHPFFALL